jgi:ABC-type Co2+ transport system permease subunit
MLLAVHIDNNVLRGPWELGGFALAAVLLVLGAWRLDHEEVPRIALLTAAFYIGSSIHVKVPLTSVHLILNALVGIVLGWRSVLAIFVGLLFQAILLGHGGYLALGVNTCIITPPALLAWLAFRGLHRVPWLHHPAARAMLVAASTAIWVLGAIAAVTLLRLQVEGLSAEEMAEETVGVLVHPVCLAVALGVGCGAAWVERRLEQAPEFPFGLLLGVVTVMLTVALNCGVLIAGGADFGATPPLVLAVAYLPVAVIEGVVLGFVVGFLAKVKPDLLGLTPRKP